MHIQEFIILLLSKSTVIAAQNYKMWNSVHWGIWFVDIIGLAYTGSNG